MWAVFQPLSQLNSDSKGSHINHDNVKFRLVSKISVILCLIFATLTAMETYIGKAITCLSPMGDKAEEMINEFCWIHGTRFIPSSQWEKMMRPMYGDSDVSRAERPPYNPFCDLTKVTCQHVLFFQNLRDRWTMGTKLFCGVKRFLDSKTTIFQGR